MIEHLTGGGFIVDLTILSKEQTEVLETLKRSVLLNSPFYRYNYPLLKPFFSEYGSYFTCNYFLQLSSKANLHLAICILQLHAIRY